MSKGYGGYMELTTESSSVLIYKYCCYNVNRDDYKQYMKQMDGEIVVSRKVLIERKCLPENLFSSGYVKVKNASGTWCVNSDGIDIMAIKMLTKLLNIYMNEGKLLKCIDWFS